MLNNRLSKNVYLEKILSVFRQITMSLTNITVLTCLIIMSDVILVNFITSRVSLTDGSGRFFSRTIPDRPWGPPSLLYNGYRNFPGGKTAGAWC